ncbi:MAG: S-layer homology domain-containing protein, partial [Firmicutes bacterium]|nr:S-layer homology domain-containing protein [Bacillota bacterium]
NYREVRVLYDGNGGTGEVADENNPYKPGKEITLLENGFEKEGYVFKEWNLEEDGSGDAYDEEESYTLDKNTTFYAIWDRLYTVKYEWTGDIPEIDDVDLPEDINEYEGLDAAKAAVDKKYVEDYTVPLEDGYNYVFSGWDEGTENEEAGTVTFKGEWTKEKDETKWFTVAYEWTGAENLPEDKRIPTNENEYLGEEAARAAVDTEYTKDLEVKGTDNKNYVFSGWNEGTLSGQVITFAGTWTKKGGGTSSEGKKYKLTYVSNGGTTYADEWYVEDVVVSLTYVPKREGYTFTGWHADEDLKNKIEKIKMTSDKTVYAGWKQTDVPTDLNGDDHFAYIVGYPDGSVMPEAQIKRSEVATIFFRLLKDDIREQYLDTENSFNDVDDTKWYNTAISTLENLGIIDGYADGGFHPENPITRAEFTAMAARFDRRNAGIEADFSDISGHWASEEISKAAENGWVDGYSDGTFLPDAKIKRCEAMAIVNRVLNRLPQSKDDLLPNMVTWPDNMNESKWFYLHVQEATNSHDCEHRADGSEYWTVLTEVPDWERYER